MDASNSINNRVFNITLVKPTIISINYYIILRNYSLPLLKNVSQYLDNKINYSTLYSGRFKSC